VTIERVRVGDVLTLRRREVSIDPMTEYRLIGIYSFGKGIFHREPKIGAELGNYRFFAIEPGDLVLSNIQAWEGAIGYASQADAGTIGTHRFLSYVPTNGRVDASWARWFFLSEPGMELIRKAPGTTIRNRTLAVDRFEALEIPLPPIDEQRRVADRLDRLHASAAELVRQSDHAAKLTEALTASAAARPDLDDEAKTRAGWRRVALSDALELNNCKVQVEAGSSFSIAGVYSFGRGMFPRTAIDESQTRYKVLHRVRTGQLVMSRLKAWEGALAVVPASLDGWFVSPEFPTFDIDSQRVDLRFIEAVLTSEHFWAQLKGASQGIGARRERVSASRLLERTVDLPPIEQQKAIGRVVENLEASKKLRGRATKRIASLVPAAVNDAFAGLN